MLFVYGLTLDVYVSGSDGTRGSEAVVAISLLVLPPFVFLLVLADVGNVPYYNVLVLF